MSKKKKRRCRGTPSLTATDCHHICFQGRYWSCGYAKAIRNALIRPVPIVWHRELHSKLNTVPVPDSSLLKQAWSKYQANKVEIDSYDVARAAAWLYVNIPDEQFREAMQFQVDFFTTRSGQL